VLAAGSSGTVDFGGGALSSSGSLDVFVGALGPAGEHQWSRRLGGPFAQSPTGVSVDADGNTIVVGSYLGAPDFGGGPLPFASETSGFVAKLDPDGDHVWSRGVLGAVPFDVDLDASGRLALTGRMVGNADFGGGPLPFAGGYDVFVAVLEADGAHVLSNSAGDGGAQHGTSVAFGSGGEVLLAAEVQGSIDLGGPTIQSDPNGSVLVLAMLDATGEHLLSLRPGGDSPLANAEVAAGPDGSLIAAGPFAGTFDLGEHPLNSGLSGPEVFVARLAP
jgi:hypothetical protein